ncbi:MAG: RING-type E3 ubiquitin-protein ligase ppil2, partial [Marteilia pararefringens]
YISTTEHRNLFGGKKLNSTSKTLNPTHYKIIPFTHCCISFQEARNPYADAQGHIYDLVNVLPFLRKFKSNPVTGEPMTTKDLFKVNIHKNEN